MISINLTAEDLADPKVGAALTSLLSALNPASSSLKPETPRAPSISTRSLPYKKSNLDIDPDVQALYGELLRKPKALYFMSEIKRAGSISSHDIYLEMERVFPHFAPRSIGGLVGAITRWTKTSGMSAPFVCQKSPLGETLFVWES
jgi:hypothetical protein